MHFTLAFTTGRTCAWADAAAEVPAIASGAAIAALMTRRETRHVTNAGLPAVVDVLALPRFLMILCPLPEADTAAGHSAEYP
jgi:hypothetical protein